MTTIIDNSIDSIACGQAHHLRFPGSHGDSLEWIRSSALSSRMCFVPPVRFFLNMKHRSFYPLLPVMQAAPSGREIDYSDDFVEAGRMFVHLSCSISWWATYSSGELRFFAVADNLGKASFAIQREIEWQGQTQLQTVEAQPAKTNNYRH